MSDMNYLSEKREECNVEIDRGLITEKGLPEGFVVTDKNVFKKYQYLMQDRECIVLAPGENTKSYRTVRRLWDEFIANDVSRVVALGGGMSGDIAAFAASTYNRGDISLVHVPSSLLAMVDSSIGGKTGINYKGVKNKIGTYFNPDLTMIDPDLLNTLPPRQFTNGLAEVIKYSIVQDNPRLLKRCMERITIDDNDLDDIIEECVSEKIKVVLGNIKRPGLREILNFGHTLGHALELYCHLLHGEAVAIGMVYESDIAVRKKMMKERTRGMLIEALENNDLPTALPKGYDLKKTLSAVRYDKKRKDGKIIISIDRKHPQVVVTEQELEEVLPAA